MLPLRIGAVSNKKIRQPSSHFARTNAAVSVVPPKLPTRWACQSLLCALPVESTAAITSGARLPLLAALRGFRGKLTGVRSDPALCAAHTCPRSLKKSGWTLLFPVNAFSCLHCITAFCPCQHSRRIFLQAVLPLRTVPRSARNDGTARTAHCPRIAG